MKTINFRKSFLLLVIILFCNLANKAQNSPQTSPEFLVGSFVAASDDKDFTYYNNYQQMLDLGLNAVYQRAIKHLDASPPYPEQNSNLTQLSIFPYIDAANDSGTGSLITSYNAQRPGNIDWINYFTQAKYTKWEAEGSPLFNENDGEDVKVKYEFGSQYTEGNITGRKTGNNPANINRYLIKGPDYWQWPRYTFTNGEWNPTEIRYKAVFQMKIDQPSETPLDVCQIMVTNTNSDGVETYLHLPGQPEIITLTTEDLLTSYKDFEFEYDYTGYFTEKSGSPDHPSPPTLVAPPNDEYRSLGLNAGSKVQFKVKWLGNRELFVDYIEVYDRDIWENLF